MARYFNTEGRCNTEEHYMVRPDDRLDMELVLEKFAEYFHDIYSENDEKFVETYGRKFFYTLNLY